MLVAVADTVADAVRGGLSELGACGAVVGRGTLAVVRGAGAGAGRVGRETARINMDGAACGSTRGRVVRAFKLDPRLDSGRIQVL